MATKTVRDYDTGATLSGSAHPDLVDASMAAEPTGAVSAYEEGGVWYHVPDSEVDHYSRHLGCDVVTVYVEVP